MRIEEVCSVFTDGDWIESKDQSEKGIRLIQTGNIGTGCFIEKDGKEKYISEDTFNRLSCTEVFPGDVLISRLPDPVGRGCIIPAKEERMITAVDCTVCRIKEDLVDRQYFCYYLQSPAYLNQLEQNVTGTTRKRISRKNLGHVEINIPDREYQLFVVDVFNKLSLVISHRQRELQRLDDLIKARFVEMFGDPELNPKEWPIEALGDVLSVEPQNGLYKPQSDYVQDGTGIPILRIDAFYDGKVTGFSGLKRLNCTDTEKNRYLLKENDIVVNRVNSIEYLGKCAWITGMIEPTVFESNMMRFHVDESIVDPCYMTRLLCSTFIYKQILNRAKKAVNQASINQGDVQRFSILLPPIELQKSFSKFVAQVDKSKFEVQRSLDEAQKLFDSLMQEYFS